MEDFKGFFKGEAIGMFKGETQNMAGDDQIQRQPRQEQMPSQRDLIAMQSQSQPQQPQEQYPAMTDQPNTENFPLDNPFSASQYQNVNVPDVPINYGGGMVESLLNDEEVPEEIKRKYWFVFHKDNVLTFLDEKRMDRKLLNFDIMKIDILNSIPYYDYTFERELEFDVLRNVFETKLDRALGVKGGNVKNERIMLQSQFSEQRQISEDGNSMKMKEGFFKRLLGRR